MFANEAPDLASALAPTGADMVVGRYQRLRRRIDIGARSLIPL